MSYQLDVDDLTHDAFQMFYECLRTLHGTAYADFVLGSPEEVVVEKFPAKRLRRSSRNQTCVSCQDDIADQHADDCIFESIEENPSIFYICNPCQNDKL